MSVYENGRISILTDNTSGYNSSVEGQNLHEMDNLKDEKDDSSSDIELIDYTDSLQSSLSTNWSVFYPPVDISNVEVKEVEKRNIGIQTDKDFKRNYQNIAIIFLKYKYILAVLLTVIIAFIFNTYITKESSLKETALIEDLRIMLKELTRDINQMKELQNSDVLFNKILNHNYSLTSVMRDIADMKLQMQKFDDVNMLKYSSLEENIKKLQDCNENLTNEVRKLRVLLEDDCTDNQEILSYLNRSNNSFIQQKINKKHCMLLKELNLGEHCKIQNNAVKSKIRNDNLNKRSNFKNWIFDRASARSKQRDINNPKDWLFDRALGRDLLRWVDKTIFAWP